MSESPTRDARLPSGPELKRLLSSTATLQSKIDEISGEMGSKIANAVEKKNLHKGAFALIKRLKRMDPVKLAAFLTHFDHYRGELEIDKLAADDLPEGDDADESDDADEQPTTRKRGRRSGKDAAAEQGADDDGDEDDGAAGGRRQSPFRSVGEAGEKLIEQNRRRLQPVT